MKSAFCLVTVLCLAFFAAVARGESAKPPKPSPEPFVETTGKKFPAFPTAEGWGAYTPGGRGGRVFVVTTLADYLPRKEPVIKGSLREAVMATGPRTVVFRVSGTIDLKNSLVIEEPFITIAGQSAPGGGICLRYYSLDIKTHDVVLRYLRVRPGDTMGRETDCISCNGQNVIIDHCSTSFGIDETLSTNGDSGYLTVQWCMITESLNQSVHHKGGHGYGSLISGMEPITYHHNLYAFHRSRNPRPGIGTLDFRNNAIVGWGDWAGYCGNDILKLNYVNNYLRPAAYSKDPEFAFRPGGTNVKIYIAGNVFTTRPEATKDNVLLVRPNEGMKPDDIKNKVIVPTPFPAATVATDTAQVAYDRILKEGGAILPARDAYDARVMDLVRTEKGQIINAQKEVGGWPELKAGEAPPDGDSDGMPDDWEKSAGLNPNDASDASGDINGDGFTNIEKYLDGLDPKKPFAWVFPPEISIDGQTKFMDSAAFTITSATEGAEVRFTMDGSEPTDGSELYARPVSIRNTTMVRARAFRRGEASHVANQLLEGLTMKEATKVEGAVQGVDYTYYENGEWRGFPDWDSLKPVKTGTTDNIGIGPTDRDAGYGLLFKGYVDVPRDGTYTFYLRSNELSLLKIDGERIAMSQSRKREYNGRIALKAGFHPIEASIYFPTEGPVRTLEVSYSGPGIEKQALAPTALFRAR